VCQYRPFLSTTEQTVPELINQISEITSTDHLTVNKFMCAAQLHPAPSHSYTSLPYM
jgi:hypothetical protein